MKFVNNVGDKYEYNEDKKQEEIKHFHGVNIILIVFLFFSLLINFMIILIHSKKKALRKGFFIIIFVQIIMEAIITFSLLLMNIRYLTNFIKDKWFVIFPILFNFGYITNILYNIRIMIYLMTLDKKKDELINYDLKEDNVGDDNSSQLSRQSTVGFTPHSFKSFHFCCFMLSIIHTIIYSLNLFKDEKKLEDSKDWNWFYYFMNGSGGKKRLFFFIFHYIFFIVSIPYLFLSINKEKISEHILLKRFSLYCIFSSLISLLFPTFVILHLIYGEKMVEIYFVLMYAFVFYLSVTWVFRVNCYYIQYVLESNGNGFCQKCAFGFKILFCCQSIPSPNFIDLNSTFIYHSLANLNDFSQDLSDNTENIEITEMK